VEQRPDDRPGHGGRRDFSSGSAINLSGQVVGGSATDNGGSDAFLWNGKKMIDLGRQAPLNGSDSDTRGINDAGQVVGTYGTGSTMHAFLYSNGTMTGLPEPSFTGGSGCVADAINNTGQIAGSCGDATGRAHLVLWHNGVVTDLGTLGTPGSYSLRPSRSTTTGRSPVRWMPAARTRGSCTVTAPSPTWAASSRRRSTTMA
jgi:probable HAF family extracellular repeat protein